MTLMRVTLRDLVLKALLDANTLAGENVFLYSWPLNKFTMPAVVINWSHDRKISNGRTVPNFTSTSILRLAIRIEEVTHLAAQEKMDILLDQIEQAILTYGPLLSLIQQFPVVETVQEVEKSNAYFISQADMMFHMETFEIYEPAAVPLDEITVTVDLVNRFDPTGTYLNPPFPDSVVPAPRSEGPDARAEGYLDITGLNN